MQPLRSAAVLAVLLATAAAQDRITLTNGDVLTGTVKTMADGKVTFTSPLLGDITVPLATIRDLSTQEPVELLTTKGETWKRRIAGIEDGRLRLDGDVPALAIADLGKINPPPAEKPKWTGSVTINGSWSDGNTVRRAAGVAAEASRRTDADRTTADAAWDYAEDKTDENDVPPRDWRLTQRRVGAGLKYDYFLTKRAYVLATTRVLGDTFADIDLRFTGGAGLGYSLIENEKTTLLTEAGLSYFHENYRSATPSQKYLAARVAYKLSHAFSDSTKLLHGVEAFPSLENADDVYLQMKTEVVTKLAGNMVGSLGWIMDYDNTPSPGLERADHRVLLSVGWSF